MSDNLSERQRRVAESYARTKSKAATARELGLSRTMVYNDLGGRDAERDSRDLVQDEIQKAEERAKRQEHIEAVRELAFREFLNRTILEAADGMTIPRPPARPVHKSNRKIKERGLILHLSDWHYAEIVDPERVSGLNSYNQAITHQRVHRVIQAFIDSVDSWEASGRFRFPELVVAANGDMMTGVIHGLQHHTDSRNIITATLQCGALFAQCLLDLAARFPKVRVYGTVGNHGRRDPRTKAPDPKDPSDSFDYLVYGIAREILRPAAHVEFHLPNSITAIYEVSGRRIYQGHGDSIRQNLGTIGYGLTAAVSRLGTTFARVGQPLDLVLFGHWHKKLFAEINGVNTCVNRSLKGTDEHGLNRYGEINVAGQECYVLDPVLGLIEEHSIFADGPGYPGTYPVAE